MSEDFINEFWDQQAERCGTSSSASWGDEYAIDLEVDLVSKFIRDGDVVLDVGCANGHATLRQAKSKKISIWGVDFSKKMIYNATESEILKNTLLHTRSNATFRVGDVRCLDFLDNTFDVVYTTRTLINLPNWEQQKLGIQECFRVCKPGGVVVLLEAFWEPLVKLNAIRSIAGLESLVEHDFNRYLKLKKLKALLSAPNDFNDATIVDFSSSYYLGTRFMRELMPSHKKFEGYAHPINKMFRDAQIQYGRGNAGFGVQQACVIRKDKI